MITLSLPVIDPVGVRGGHRLGASVLSVMVKVCNRLSAAVNV